MIPTQLKERVYRFVLLKKATKIPFEEGWQKKGYQYDNPKLLKHIADGGNYGVIGGFGSLRILDIDEQSLGKQIKKQLDTFTVRSGSGGLHFYLISDYNKNHVLINNKGELRANAYQVVGANCTHPNGNKYSIENDTSILDITEKDLLNIIEPYKRKEFESSQSEGRDNSRSATEYRKVIWLIKNGCTKEKVFSEMSMYAKWSTAPPQYRELTYNKALDWVDKQTVMRPIEESEKIDTAVNLITGYTDYLDLASRFYEVQPFFYDKQKLWWLWDFTSNSYKIMDDVDLMNKIDDSIKKTETIKSKVKNEIIESLQRVGRRKVPRNLSANKIQFKDKFFDIKTKEITQVTPELFATNPIPWELGESEDTPTIDKLFTEWVGPDYIDLLYEIIAYCCLRDYPIHLIFCLIGVGRNGKSRFLALLTKFIGKDNVCSTELDTLLDSRFESFKLYKKLACTMGETNFGLLTKTSLLKRLCGQDMIGYEYKNKQPFDDYNYAKILISSNALPSSADTSEGFYRRWLIVDFPNTFQEGKDILETIPEQEYHNLSKKITNILPRLLVSCKFSKQGTVEERQKRYIAASNPLSIFIEDNCVRGTELYMKYSELYLNYIKYLLKHKRRKISRKEFKNVLDDEGLDVSKTTKYDGMNNPDNGYFIDGVEMKNTTKVSVDYEEKVE